MRRDRSIDALRAVAIAGVVGGHWLVTGLVVDGEGAWRQASPLTSMPGFVPVSWILQTLGLFFFAGGFAAARSARRPALRKLAVPLAVVLGGWTLVLVTATALGLPDGTRSTIIKLVVSPLWFLLPYLALGFATGPLTRAVDRAGTFPLVAPAAIVVALSDAGLVPAWAAVVAAWSIPWILGIALARRGRSVLPAAGLLIGGLAALAVLVVALDYPASAVGVPGDGRSNLSPPSLFAVALAAAQIGLFLLIRDAYGRSRREAVDGASTTSYPPPTVRPTQCRGGGGGGLRAGRPTRCPGGGGGGLSAGRPTPYRGGRAGARGPARALTATAVASLNRAALPIYLIHQSVFVAVVAAAAAIWPQPVPGLLTAPQDPQWIIARVAWLPFLALTLAALIRVSWRTTRPQERLEPPLSGKLLDGPNDESRPTEVIAVRDSDPPSRGRAARQRL